MSLFLSLSVLLAAAPPQGGVERELFRRDGFMANVGLGLQVGFLTDLDGDGAEEFSVSSTRDWVAEVHDGASGVLLMRFPSVSGDLRVVVIGDADGDGVDDLALGDSRLQDPLGNWLGGFHVLSGSTGNLIYTRYGDGIATSVGYSLVALDDLDGDGVGELAVETWSSVWICSGASGRILFTVNTGVSPRYVSLVALGDLDGDGHLDWGRTWYDSQVLRTVLRAWSGASGAWIRDFDAGPGDWYPYSFGDACASVGDLDLDGVPDLGFGAPAGWNCVHFGHLLVLSGADGSTLVDLTGLELQLPYLGSNLAGAGDVDLDGVTDVALTSPVTVTTPQDSWAAVVSLASGEVLHAWWADLANGFLPGIVDAGGDSDGDGTPELILGSPWGDGGVGSRSGTVSIRSWQPGIRASGASLSASGGGFLGYALDFPAAAAGDSYQLLFSASGTGPNLLGGLVVPLSVDPLFARCFLGDYPSVVRLAVGTLDGQGDGYAYLLAKPGQLPASLVGRSFHAAAVTSSSVAGWRFSSIARAIEITP